MLPICDTDGNENPLNILAVASTLYMGWNGGGGTNGYRSNPPTSRLDTNIFSQSSKISRAFFSLSRTNILCCFGIALWLFLRRYIER